MLDRLAKLHSGIEGLETMPATLNNMRDAMRKIMSDSYISGSNDNFEAMKGNK